MNTTSSVSVAFDPLLPWEVLAVLAGIGLVLVLLGLRAGARGTIWRTGAVAIAFLGDGTLGEGVVYEALNLALAAGAGDVVKVCVCVCCCC